jgi:hypothetical protein
MLLRLPSADPKGAAEVEDHNAGVSFVNLLHGYLGKRGLRARRFFAGVLQDAAVAPLVERVESLRTAWHSDRRADRRIFDDLKRLQSQAFARSKMADLTHLFAGARAADADALRGRPRPKRRLSTGVLVH